MPPEVIPQSAAPFYITPLTGSAPAAVANHQAAKTSFHHSSTRAQVVIFHAVDCHHLLMVPPDYAKPFFIDQLQTLLTPARATINQQLNGEIKNPHKD